MTGQKTNSPRKSNTTIVYPKQLRRVYCGYGAVIWELTRELKIDWWPLRWTTGEEIAASQDYIMLKTRQSIRQMMNVKKTIIDTVDRKKLVWYGNLQHMGGLRWPTKQNVTMGSNIADKASKTTKKLEKTIYRQSYEVRELQNGSTRNLAYIYRYC